MVSETGTRCIAWHGNTHKVYTHVERAGKWEEFISSAQYQAFEGKLSLGRITKTDSGFCGKKEEETGAGHSPALTTQ